MEGTRHHQGVQSTHSPLPFSPLSPDTSEQGAEDADEDSDAEGKASSTHSAGQQQKKKKRACPAVSPFSYTRKRSRHDDKHPEFTTTDGADDDNADTESHEFEREATFEGFIDEYQTAEKAEDNQHTSITQENPIKWVLNHQVVNNRPATDDCSKPSPPQSKPPSPQQTASDHGVPSTTKSPANSTSQSAHSSRASTCQRSSLDVALASGQVLLWVL